MGKFFVCVLCCVVFSIVLSSIIYSNGWNLGQQLVCLSRGDSVGASIGIMTCQFPFTIHDLLVVIGWATIVWFFYK